VSDTPDILKAALNCLDARLCVLPARLDQKRPVVSSWKQYQQRLPTPVEVKAWFSNGHAMCILTGAVSGNLEMLDFDAGGALFDRWAQMVEEQSPGLLARLVMEHSQRGGRHVAYRSAVPVCGSTKLAQRLGPEGRPQTLIETRGEGGLFLCAPSSGYELLQGDFTSLPILTPDERDILLSAAWALNEHLPAPEPIPAGCSNLARPGDDFAERGDVRAVLARHGWTLAKGGQNEYWRRPGKTAGWSATLKDRVLYVFSSNAAPFEPSKAYSPFGMYALLEHNGDYSTAASALRALDYGQDTPGAGVDISGIVAQATQQADPPPALVDDPGPVPWGLLRIPGFVSEVMDFCLQTAPYPSQMMAFCGAVALQSFLAARKVRDPGDNRTNLYLLGLAYSSAGKDWPRKLNAKDLSPEQVRAYRIADNKTAELAEWNMDLLPIEVAALAAADWDMGQFGFSAEELSRLLEGDLKDGLVDPDDVPAQPDEAITQRGDLWILGEHRLLCGDSGSVEDLDRLMDGQPVHLVNTDPPYGVKVEPRSNNAIAAGLSSFESPKADYRGEDGHRTGRGKRGLTHHQQSDVDRNGVPREVTGPGPDGG
jgi:hypothetical protein